MKKTFLKLCAALLACCSVFGCMIFTASADAGTASTPLQTKWDFGDAAMGLETFKKMNTAQSTVGYEYIAFSKTNDYDKKVLKNLSGAYPMVWGDTYMSDVPGFIPSLEYRDDITAPTSVNEHWIRYRPLADKPAGAYARIKSAANSSISPGIAFTANQTGTIRFEFQYSYDNASLADANLTKIWCGKVGEMKYKGQSKFDETTAICSPDATKTNEIQTWTIEMDVKAGDKICFVVQYNFSYADKIIDVLMHLRSAEYIAGDLTANPVTYVCAQETKASNGKFNVRISSAICEAKAGNAESGYYIIVKYDGVVVEGKDNVKCVIDNAYETLVAYDENGVVTDRLESLQGTYWMSGVIEDLDATKNVTLIIRAFSGDYLDSEITVEYENGVFKSSASK